MRGQYTQGRRTHRTYPPRVMCIFSMLCIYIYGVAFCIAFAMNNTQPMLLVHTSCSIVRTAVRYSIEFKFIACL